MAVRQYTCAIYRLNLETYPYENINECLVVGFDVKKKIFFFVIIS